jgi:hypothetical protein
MRFATVTVLAAARRPNPANLDKLRSLGYL